jgi:hypothetical protein
MKPNLQGLTWFDCHGTSQEELFRQFYVSVDNSKYICVNNYN